MAANDDSILDSTKKMVGIEPDYTPFDIDITIHINSVFSTLFQLGIGPVDGYMITGKENKWSEFIEDKAYLSQVKSYMYLRVRNLFDPPTTSFALAANKEQILEFEWRLSLYAPKAVYPVPEEG